MKRHSTIASTLVLTASLCACAPTAALSAGPLLSGYGGPGAGTQAILGSTLIGGGGSQGGDGSQGGGSQAAGGATTATPTSGSAPATHTGGSAQGTRVGRSGGHTGSAFGRSSATPSRAAGATPSISSPLEDASATSVSWFSGADTLAVALAAATLLLVGLATGRLARTEHH